MIVCSGGGVGSTIAPATDDFVIEGSAGFITNSGKSHLVPQRVGPLRSPSLCLSVPAMLSIWVNRLTYLNVVLINEVFHLHPLIQEPT